MQISSLTHASTPTPRRWTIVLLCACMVLGSMATPDSAHAARKKKSSDTTSEPAQKKGNVKIKHQRSPSEESTAERDRRLYRECKGLPNAGACHNKSTIVLFVIFEWIVVRMTTLTDRDA